MSPASSTMDYSLCVQRTSLSIEGRTIQWRDGMGLTLRSFEHASPPLDAVFSSFHDELVLCVLQSPQLLRLHYLEQGGAQDIHLKFEFQHILYCHRYQVLLCVSPSTGLYSISWPHLQPYPIAIHPEALSSVLNICASTVDVVCSVHDSVLRVWRLEPYQGDFDEERRLSISASHRSAMSPGTDSRLSVSTLRVIQ